MRFLLGAAARWSLTGGPLCFVDPRTRRGVGWARPAAPRAPRAAIVQSHHPNSPAERGGGDHVVALRSCRHSNRPARSGRLGARRRRCARQPARGQLQARHHADLGAAPGGLPIRIRRSGRREPHRPDLPGRLRRQPPRHRLPRSAVGTRRRAREQEHARRDRRGRPDRLLQERGRHRARDDRARVGHRLRSGGQHASARGTRHARHLGPGRHHHGRRLRLPRLRERGDRRLHRQRGRVAPAGARLLHHRQQRRPVARNRSRGRRLRRLRRQGARGRRRARPGHRRPDRRSQHRG